MEHHSETLGNVVFSLNVQGEEALTRIYFVQKTVDSHNNAIGYLSSASDTIQ
jgi:hypothetical protein